MHWAEHSLFNHEDPRHYWRITRSSNGLWEYVELSTDRVLYTCPYPGIRIIQIH